MTGAMRENIAMELPQVGCNESGGIVGLSGATGLRYGLRKQTSPADHHKLDAMPGCDMLHAHPVRCL